MYVTHLAIVPVFQKVDNTIYPLDKSLSTVYYYFIFCTVIILKKLKSKYIVLSGNYVLFCLASHGNLMTGEIAYRIVLSCCITGESQKMMPEEHSSWQEAMPSTLLLCLLHGLNLSCY